MRIHCGRPPAGPKDESQGKQRVERTRRAGVPYSEKKASFSMATMTTRWGCYWTTNTRRLPAPISPSLLLLLRKLQGGIRSGSRHLRYPICPRRS